MARMQGWYKNDDEIISCLTKALSQHKRPYLESNFNKSENGSY